MGQQGRIGGSDAKGGIESDMAAALLFLSSSFYGSSIASWNASIIVQFSYKYLLNALPHVLVEMYQTYRHALSHCFPVNFFILHRYSFIFSLDLYLRTMYVRLK